MSAGGAGRGKKRKAKGKPAGDSEDVVDCTDDPYEFPGDVQPPVKDAGVLAGCGAPALPSAEQEIRQTRTACCTCALLGCKALS